MRASLRPQKRDHVSASNTPTHRKVVHLRRCAEALLLSTSSSSSSSSKEKEEKESTRATREKENASKTFLAAEISLRAIRMAREADLPRKLIDQFKYCVRCGLPKEKRSGRKEEEGEEETNTTTTTNNNINNNNKNNRCLCCEYSFAKKKRRNRKKKKKKRKSTL
jgi:hypothetical protein